MSIVIITGGAGFVGSNLAEFLVGRGDTVVSLDNYSSGARNHVEGCNYFHCDLSERRDLSFVNRFGNPDCVFHLAAATRIQPSFSDPRRYWRSNCDATFNVLEMVREWGCPFVYSGSSSHHGGRFMNPYTFTKDVGEDIVRLYSELFGVRASVLRLYNVYGPRESEDEQFSTLIGRWKRNLAMGLPLVVYGDGKKKRDFTHVADVVDAMVRVLDRGAYGHTFEIGRGDPKSVDEILGYFGVPGVYEAEKEGEVAESCRTNELARSVLGWDPSRNVKDYIRCALE